MALRDDLMASDDRFRNLAQEHTQYASKLDALNSKPYLNDEDKIEEVRLKKLKLKVKDQMETIERSFRTHGHVA